MVRINITIPEELLESLDKFAEGSGYNRSEYIRELVRRGVLDQMVKASPAIRKKPPTAKEIKEAYKEQLNLCEHGAAPTFCKKKNCRNYAAWR